METTQEQIDHLLRLEAGVEREEFLEENPDLRSDEVAGALCRTSVVLLFRDFGRAREICDLLSQIADSAATPLTAGYRDHAWAAFYQQTGSDYARALELWQRAIASFERAGREDQVAISSYSGLHTPLMLGNLDLFWEWEKRARRFFEQTGDRLRLARLTNNVGNLYARQDRWDEAARFFESAYQELLVLGGNEYDLEATLVCLSTAYSNLGDRARALRFLEKARRLCEYHGLHVTAARVDDSIAYIRFLQGEFAESLHLSRRARERFRQHGQLSHWALSTLDQAEMFLRLCIPRESEQLGRAALAGYRELGLDLEQARALMVLGLCCRAQRRFNTALDLLDQAAHLFKTAGNQPKASTCELYKATVQFERGDLRRSLETVARLEAGLDPDARDSLPLTCELLQAQLLLEQGRLSEARLHAEAVVRRVGFLDQTLLEAEAFLVLGKVLEACGDEEHAFVTYLRCERCIDQVWHSLSPGENKTTFLSDKTSVYESLFVLALRRHELDKAFEFAERAKSRSLAELLSRRMLEASWREMKPEPLPAFEELRDATSPDSAYSRSATAQTSAAVARTSDPSVQPNEAPQGATRTRELVITGESRGAIASRYLDDELPPLSQVAATLPPDAALLEYFFARGRALLLIITTDDIQMFPLGDVAKLRAQCRLLRFALRARRQARDTMREGRDALLSYLRALHAELLPDVLQDLGAEHLIFAPHGFLHEVPFHALFDGSRFLIERFAVSSVPSASVLYFCRTRVRSPATGLVVFACPDDAAPCIAEEGRAVASCFAQSGLFTGTEATVAQLQEAICAARLVHIAAHGAFDSADPLLSRLSLTDGSITVRDLQNMELAAELVVLSGCDSGRNGTRGSDEVIGLAQGLLQAGARSALVSLWAIEDEVTVEFMTEFYRRLSLGVSTANAVREAMLDHRRHHEDPMQWAPFVLVGDAA